METTTWDKITFVDSIDDFDFIRYADHIIHILCTKGSMSFIFRDVRYNITAGDYVILPNVALVSGFSQSPDLKAFIMSLSGSFFTSMAIQSSYGIVGQLSLLQNPVMRLDGHDFRICVEDMQRLRNRMQETAHRFRDEMLGHLLLAHVLDLYDIHIRHRPPLQISGRTADLLKRFIELLWKGEYVSHRDLTYYAGRLCITPQYLSEICKKVSGFPATYWIDRFTLHEISRLLRQDELSLSEIADRLHFSSSSYFSRYVQNKLGVSPTEFRSRGQGD